MMKSKYFHSMKIKDNVYASLAFFTAEWRTLPSVRKVLLFCVFQRYDAKEAQQEFQ